jgi:soluble lytic murein transglycosylase-like protein
MACDPATIQKIYSYATRYGIDPNVALAQIRQESGCRPAVCSSAGACGIAQFLPGTWSQYGSGSRTDVDASLTAWGLYMQHLLSIFGGDYRLALAGYHSGEGAARAALANPAGNPKTNNYVNSILGATGNPTTATPGSEPGQLDLSSIFSGDDNTILYVVAGALILLLITR